MVSEKQQEMNYELEQGIEKEKETTENSVRKPAKPKAVKFIKVVTCIKIGMIILGILLVSVAGVFSNQVVENLGGDSVAYTIGALIGASFISIVIQAAILISIEDVRKMMLGVLLCIEVIRAVAAMNIVAIILSAALLLVFFISDGVKEYFSHENEQEQELIAEEQEI
ncbi:MAG: hypothetical protein ACOCM4_11625 [Acetivibrio ethanolgignens]